MGLPHSGADACLSTTRVLLIASPACGPRPPCTPVSATGSNVWSLRPPPNAPLHQEGRDRASGTVRMMGDRAQHPGTPLTSLCHVQRSPCRVSLPAACLLERLGFLKSLVDTCPPCRE